MNIINYIVFKKLLVIHINISENGYLTNSSLIFNRKNKKYILVDSKADGKNFLDSKNFKWPVLIIISGDYVIERNTNNENFNFERFENNPDILANKYVSDGIETIAFVRKNIVEEKISELKKYKLNIIRIIIRKDFNIKKITEDTDYLNFNNLFSSFSDRLDFLCKVLYDVSKLWFLFLFLIILIFNYLKFHELKKEYTVEQEQLVLISNKNVKNNENNIYKNVLHKNLKKRSLKLRNTFVIDQIAAIIPEDILLNNMIISPREIGDNTKKDKSLSNNNFVVISGQSLNSNSVISFCEKLKNNQIIKSVYISSMYVEKENFIFKIEIECTI